MTICLQEKISYYRYKVAAMCFFAVQEAIYYRVTVAY